MPLLPDPISSPNVKQFYLPKPDKDENGQLLPVDKQAWVKMDVQGMTGADSTRLTGVGQDWYGHWLSNRILEWNFVDESGIPIPITYENVVRLGGANIAYLRQVKLDVVHPLSDDQKKTSTPTSTPA